MSKHIGRIQNKSATSLVAKDMEINNEMIFYEILFIGGNT